MRRIGLNIANLIRPAPAVHKFFLKNGRPDLTIDFAGNIRQSPVTVAKKHPARGHPPPFKLLRGRSRPPSAGKTS